MGRTRLRILLFDWRRCGFGCVRKFVLLPAFFRLLNELRPVDAVYKDGVADRVVKYCKRRAKPQSSDAVTKYKNAKQRDRNAEEPVGGRSDERPKTLLASASNDRARDALSGVENYKDHEHWPGKTHLVCNSLLICEQEKDEVFTYH